MFGFFKKEKVTQDLADRIYEKVLDDTAEALCKRYSELISVEVIPELDKYFAAHKGEIAASLGEAGVAHINEFMKSMMGNLGKNLEYYGKDMFDSL